MRATLKQTIESHRQTLDHLATPIAMFDKRQQLQFYNSSFAKMWGLGEAFLSGEPSNAQVLDAFREEHKLPERPDWRKWRESPARDLPGGRTARRNSGISADGQTMRVVVNPHTEGGATWLFEDVTERLALESNYNALMQVQGETLDHLSEAVAVFGFDGRLKIVQSGLRGTVAARRRKAPRPAHISPGFPARAGQGLPTTLHGMRLPTPLPISTRWRGEKAGRLETVDGKVLDYGLVPLPDGQTMLTLMDMTAAVDVERALKERNEALEQSDLLKSRFIQHVSYELRAPLTSISGFSEMLAMNEIGKLNAKQGEYVEHISSAAGTLKSIIDDILDLATIDAGAMTLDIEPTALRPVIESCLEQLDQAIAAHGLKTEIAIADDAESLPTDPQRMRQILFNLLANAVSVSPDGGKVSVTAAHVGDMIEIAVADEGPGIAREDRQRIFDRFEGRAAGGHHRRGTGLGLSIVESFVKLHGGTVHVEDAGERGARFVCRFPSAQKATQVAA